MSALKYQKAALYLLLVFLFLNINTTPTSFNFQVSKLQNSYEAIKNVKFTDNNSIFFSTKDNRKFGYIDLQQGQLYNIFQLEQHQTIINENTKSIVIRNQDKGLIFFDIKTGQQKIDQTLKNIQKQNFTQVISFVQTKLGKYVLTQKDLRFLQFKKQQTGNGYKRHEHLSSQQQNKETYSQRNRATQNQQQKNLEAVIDPQKYQIIYQMDEKQQRSQPIQTFYDLIAFPSKEISSRVVLVVLFQSCSKKLICFKQFRGKDMFDGKCHQIPTLNLISIQVSGQYFYVQIGKTRKTKSKTYATQQYIKKQDILNSLYQKANVQIQGIFNTLKSDYTSTIVFSNNLEPITIFKKQIQQTHEGCAIFVNHQTYNPEHQNYFQYRIIDDGIEPGNVRAIIGKQAIYIADIRTNLSSPFTKKSQTDQTDCTNKKDQLSSVSQQMLKQVDKSFLVRIKKQKMQKYSDPISMFIYTEQYKNHYYFLIQFQDNSISLYQLFHHSKHSSPKYDLKSRKIWQIQSISSQVLQLNQQIVESQKGFKKKTNSSGHSQQLFGESGQYL